jgi:undecaprenyl-diphosphatase
VILGLVQGFTEFLPISSSAHLQIASQLLGLGSMPKPQLTALIATIQLGTEAAVLIYFWKDIIRIAKAWIGSITNRGFVTEEKKRDSKLGWLIIIGSLPVVGIGLVFKHQIENGLRSLWVIAISLIVFGIVLGVADLIGKKQKSIEQITTRDGLLFGLGQALAVIPGVSRSGGTISVGLLLGYSRQAAARYSFLLAIPAVIASGLFEFVTSVSDLTPDLLIGTAVATVISFVVGYSVIVVLLKYLARGSFTPFVAWRLIVGIWLLAMLTSGQFTA